MSFQQVTVLACEILPEQSKSYMNRYKLKKVTFFWFCKDENHINNYLSRQSSNIGHQKCRF